MLGVQFVRYSSSLLGYYYHITIYNCVSEINRFKKVLILFLDLGNFSPLCLFNNEKKTEGSI